MQSMIGVLSFLKSSLPQKVHFMHISLTSALPENLCEIFHYHTPFIIPANYTFLIQTAWHNSLINKVSRYLSIVDGVVV